MKNSATNDELKKLIIMVIVVTGIFLAFYGVTIFMTHDNEETQEEVKAEIQYTEILLSNILNQESDEYYVILSKNDQFKLQLYNSYISVYAGMEDSLKMYLVNIDNPFNESYIGEESNLEIDDINDLVVNDDALLVIEDNEVVDVYEGKEKIVEFMTEIITEE